jgi:hypothetical protein
MGNHHLWVLFHMICERVCFRSGNSFYDCSCINNSCVKSTNVEESHRMTIRDYISLIIWYVSCGVAYVLLIYVRRLWLLITSSYLFIYSLFNDAVNNSLLHYAILPFKSCDSAVKLAFRMHPGQSEACKRTYCGLMGCNTMLFGRWISAFRRNMLSVPILNFEPAGILKILDHSTKLQRRHIPEAPDLNSPAIRRPYLIW